MQEVSGRLRKTHYHEMIFDRYTIATSKMLQKKSSENRTITSILNKEGNLVVNQKEVLSEYKSQYFDLFKAGETDPTSVYEFLADKPFNVASDDDRNIMGSEISESEILEADFFKKI